MEEITNFEQKDSIKLIKNTKGFNWEIKIYVDKSKDQRKEDDISLGRLDYLNKKLNEKYGRDSNE